MIKIYVHVTTIRHLDYGELLSLQHGVMLSMTGERSDAFGFEREVTFADVAARMREYIDAGKLELVAGARIIKTIDSNPHGHI